MAGYEELQIPSDFTLIEDKVEVPNDFTLIETEEEKKKRQEAELIEKKKAEQLKKKQEEEAAAQAKIKEEEAKNKIEEDPDVENIEVDPLDGANDQESGDPTTYTSSKEILKAFEDKYNINLRKIKKTDKTNPINDYLQSLQDEAEEALTAELNVEFPEGMDNFIGLNDNGEKQWLGDAESLDIFNEIQARHTVKKEELLKTQKDIDFLVTEYNKLITVENKNHQVLFLNKVAEAEAHALNLENTLYYHYSRNGKLKGVYNYNDIRNIYVDGPRYTYKEFKELYPKIGNIDKPVADISEKKLQKEYLNGIYSLPKFNSVEEYIEKWNTDGTAQGAGYWLASDKKYVDKSGFNLGFLDEFEVVTTKEEVKEAKNRKKERLSNYNDLANRRTYFSSRDDNGFVSIYSPIIAEQKAEQAIPALSQILPQHIVLFNNGYSVDLWDTRLNPEDPTATHKIVFGYNRPNLWGIGDWDDKEISEHNAGIAEWLSQHTTAPDIAYMEQQKQNINDYVEELNEKDSNEGGLNVEWKRDGMINAYMNPLTSSESAGNVKYAANTIAQLFGGGENKFGPATVTQQTVNMFNFSPTQIAMSVDKGENSRLDQQIALGIAGYTTVNGIQYKNDINDKNSEALNAAFNAFLESSAIGGVGGDVNISSLPIYRQSASIEQGDPGILNKDGRYLSRGKYNKVPAEVGAISLQSLEDYNRIKEYSLKNEEALFSYTAKDGTKKIFDTEEWSKNNNGKNFTQHLATLAVTDFLVPEQIFDAKKEVVENFIEIDRWENDERLVQGKLILGQLNIKQNQKNKLVALNIESKEIKQKYETQSLYSLETLQALQNDPNYEIDVDLFGADGEIVEIPTNYKGADGEFVKKLVPKKITDQARVELNSAISLGQRAKTNVAEFDALLEEMPSDNERWEAYKLNYSDFDMNVENFLLGGADFVGNILYGGYKYLTPVGWVNSALKGGGVIKEDPITEVMLGWKTYKENHMNTYNLPNFETINSFGDFSSWFFNMAGTQVWQFSTMALSGGSAYVPLTLLGLSATGDRDLNYRSQIAKGNLTMNEGGIMWRSILSGIGEGTLGSLGQFRIIQKGLGLAKGANQFVDDVWVASRRQYFRQQASPLIKDLALDVGGENINQIFNNMLDGNPYTDGLGEVTATSLLMSGPIAVASPVYYGLATKDFIAADIRNNIDEQTYELKQLKDKSSYLTKQMEGMLTSNLGKPFNPTVSLKVKNLNQQIALNNEAISSLEIDLTESWNNFDYQFKNVGLNSYVNSVGVNNYTSMLKKMSLIKAEALTLINDKNIAPSLKESKLELLNNMYSGLNQSKNKYLSKKYWSNPYYALQGSGFFNKKNKAKLEELDRKAEEAILQDKGLKHNPTAQEIQDKAVEIYNTELALEQANIDKKANPDLVIVESFEDAETIVNNSDLSEVDKKATINKLKSKTKNGFTVVNPNGKNIELAYIPNMAHNSMFHTGGHETSHTPSAKLMMENPEKFTGFGEQLLAYMEDLDPRVWEVIQAENSGLKNKDGSWDYTEVIASFIEATGGPNPKIKADDLTKGNFPALFATLLNKGLHEASDGDYTIPFRGQNDVVQYFIGMAAAMNKGEINVGTYTERLTELVESQTPVVDINQQTEATDQPVSAAASNIKSSDVTLLEAINNLLPKDINTKEKFDEFIRDERKAKVVIDSLNKPGGAINNYIRSKQVSPEEGNQMIENTLFRLFNFNPEETRADGSVVGPEGFGERIFADTRFASMDARKNLAKEAEKKKQETRMDDEEAKQVAADDSPKSKPEDKKSRVTPKSKIPKAFPEVINQELKDDFMAAALEIYESELPPISEKEFKAVVADIFRGKMTDKVKKALGNNKMYEFTVKKMAPVMKDLLPPQWFVRLESQVKPEDRIFTKPPRRLTKQADIDKALDNDKVYVENTKQGVNLYEFKDFKPQELIEFLLPPLKITSKKTGKEVRSGLRGNRKTAFAEGITDQLGKDVSPSAAKIAGKTPNEIAEIAKKMQVESTIKFSDVHNEIRNVYGGQLDYYDTTNPKKAAKSVTKVKDFVVDVLAPMLGGDIYNLIDSNNLAPIGNRWFKNVNKGLFMGDVFPMSKKNINLYNETVAINEALVAEGVLGTLKDLVADVEASSGIKKGQEKTNTSKVLAKQDLSKLQDNLDNLVENQKAVEVVIKAFKKAYDSDNSLLPVIKEFFYNPLASKMWGKNAALVRSTIDGIVKGDKKYEEHTYQFGNWALRTGQAIKSKNKDVYNGWLKWQRDNYYQTVFDRKTLMMGSPYQTKAFEKGTVFIPVDPTMMDYQNIVDKKYVKDGILWEAQSGEHPLLKQKLDEAFKTGDFSEVPPSEIRFFNEYFSLNPFTLRLDGKTFAEKYGLKVDPSLESNPDVAKFAGDLIYQQILTKSGELIGKAAMTPQKAQQLLDKALPVLIAENNTKNSSTVPLVVSSEVMNMDNSENMSTNDVLNKAKTLDTALNKANSLDQPIKKIRVFDFDDTLATSKNIVIATKDGKTKKLNAEEFAKQGLELKEDGWDMDFSDFNNVTEGGRGPLFDVAQTIKKARGNEDLFVLTARAPQAQDAIYEFLKAEGLEFKRENIIGLGDSTGKAKADWLVGKAAEGYNDFYFADDAFQNVSAVELAMSQLDVKSKVQQAKIKSSEVLSEDFNKLLEESTGVEFYKEYSPVKAKTVGASKGKFKFFIPYSAEDFTGLIYPTLAKGSTGDRQMAWYKKNLLDPYTRAQENLSAARLNLMNDFKALKKSLDVPKDLRKKNETGLTNEQAVRVYLFNQMGYDVPGLSKRDLQELTDIVNSNGKLKVFADQILTITKGDGYIKPKPDWQVGTITTDLVDLINTEKRAKYLAEWQQNADAIYSEKNLNKLEALYGTKYVEALKGILSRMKSGRNRLETGNRLSNKMLDYINGSIGTIMFFNTRSAVLQTISSINFLNWSFNNPYQAGKAFANQKQYWTDFVTLMNSDYLKDRRNGLKLNIQESEIADAAATAKNKSKAVLNYILQKGYLPTQYADSFAIAAGGATFYRNKVNDLIKNEGMSQAEAEAQALVEWRQVAEESQQSSDPSRISAQQSGDFGRLILAFGNTPMQYARIQKRAIQDLVNGRGDAKTNVSKIIYYGVIQNIMFNALQQAVFALGFGDDDEDASNERIYNTLNGSLDSLLRGLGIGGVAVSTAKNFLLNVYERSGRKRPEYVDSVWELLRFSPPIYSKISKLKQAAWQFDSKKRRQKIFDKGFSLDNPAYEAFAKVVSATANIPIDRLFYKFKNIEGALNSDNEMWQRVAMAAGWPKWQLEKPKTDKQKEEERQDKLSPEEKIAEEAVKKGIKESDKISKAKARVKAAKGSTDYDTLKKLTSAEQIKMLKGLGYGEYTIKNAKTEDDKIKLIIHKNSGKKIKVDKISVATYKYKKLNKAEQVAKLDSLGLSKAQIKALKYEEDRVNKIIELMKGQ